MSEERRTAKREILRTLAVAPHPLAVHELKIPGYSENCLATRLSELAAAGLVKGSTREGKAYKEWQAVAENPAPNDQVKP